jgi:hypothetical protein
MILENHIRGRRRVLDAAKKARLCELISHESYSVEQAAESLDVSLRTVQRERKYDQDFDHEVRLALQDPPDPLKLMEHAARTHWRAAAWLLERRQPEEFARKPVNATSAKRVDAALRYLQEAALEAIPPELHAAVYRHTQAALEKGLAECFPAMGEWNRPKPKSVPIQTPLADAQYRQVWDEQTAAGWPVLPSEPVILSPKTPETTESETTEIKADMSPRFFKPGADATPRAAEPSAEEIPSPKIAEATEFNETTASDATKSTATEIPPPAPLMMTPESKVALLEELVSQKCPEAWFENDDFDHPDADDPQQRILLLDERLRRHRRRERQKERAAEKKAKAAKKRAEAQRRRAA